MKKFIYIISMVMLSSIIAGCSSETNASLNTEDITFEKEDKIEAEDEFSAVQTEGKEKKDSVWLKNKSLYQFEAADGKLKYTVYLFAEDQGNTILEEDSQKGKKGDSYYTGHYSVYLAEKDSKVAYKQDVLSEASEMVFNSSQEQVYTLKMRNKTIISVFQPKGQDEAKGHLLAVKDGEVIEISSEKDVITSSLAKIKRVNQKFIQTVQNRQDKWVVSTWLFNEETLSLTLHDREELGSENNASWMNKWIEDEAFYYPFKNLELSSDVIEKAKQGIPLGSPYPIGTNISEIKKSEPDFIKEGFEDESPYVMYPDITYYYESETRNVTAISIPGQRMRTTIDEIKTLFGNPAEVKDDPNTGGTLSVYTADKYAIEVFSDQAGQVSKIHLTKTKNHAE
ncbi:hypothetical protein DFO73_113154 [Cytobacillus oceanisediminis]|uniref:DUF4309 domain-containing protein n=1 Tax=Cytobacillus oceanisediminis TaxID=665099 RepID=A0A2V2ZND1_9BACI|nr:hypothetical protein [Cytobacillus oceanisediminis]PWW25554.1 hypothetical protein DFO73_113154 [Cytobacillus oceanisediminis]